jgi:NAD(P)-dependent dehydrogenase (short-subunit alcohol dehydrogenase family)
MAKVLVIGASRGVGLETVGTALRAGHSVRALARSVARIRIQNAVLDKVAGGALDRDTIRNALQDGDAVIQTLGVHFSPRTIFEGTTLFSGSTRILVDAMQVAGVKWVLPKAHIRNVGEAFERLAAFQAGLQGIPRDLPDGGRLIGHARQLNKPRAMPPLIALPPAPW